MGIYHASRRELNFTGIGGYGRKVCIFKRDNGLNGSDHWHYFHGLNFGLWVLCCVLLFRLFFIAVRGYAWRVSRVHNESSGIAPFAEKVKMD